LLIWKSRGKQSKVYLTLLSRLALIVESLLCSPFTLGWLSNATIHQMFKLVNNISNVYFSRNLNVYNYFELCTILAPRCDHALNSWSWWTIFRKLPFQKFECLYFELCTILASRCDHALNSWIGAGKQYIESLPFQKFACLYFELCTILAPRCHHALNVGAGKQYIESLPLDISICLFWVIHNN